jgi:hypothetical protein
MPLREAIFSVFRDNQAGDYGDRSACISVARFRTIVHKYLACFTDDDLQSELTKMKDEGLLVEKQLLMGADYCLTPQGKTAAFG